MPDTPSRNAEHALQSERMTRQSLERSRRGLLNSLSIPCPECAAKPGTYCTADARGLCRYRWDKGLTLSVPAPLAPATAGLPAPVLATPGSKTEPDRRHPNRHPVRSAR
jgi:hypothetical protein